MSKISIITISYNSEKTIEETIKSVAKQTYKNIEYIIIDGGSKDKTIDIIKKYENYIDHWKSEPDKGIYDAMNKGVKNSTGELIYFLNSDDYLCDETIIEKVIKEYEESKRPDILYGNVIVIDLKRNIEFEQGFEISNELLSKGNMIPHQAVFMKRDVFVSNNMFNNKLRIVSDYEMIVKCSINSCKFKYMNRNVAYFRVGGISSSYKFYSLYSIEMLKVIYKYYKLTALIRYLPKAGIKISKGIIKSTIAGLKSLKKMVIN